VNTPTYDTLIIGQGLAGSLLAWHLLEQGQRIMIINSEETRCASRMAAGLINPVTGKRLVKSAWIGRFLPTALSLYGELAAVFAQPFYHQQSMIRLFRTADEIHAWEKRAADPDYQAYLETATLQDCPPSIQAPLGGFRQLQTGYLDTTALLDSLDAYFVQHDACLRKTVQYEDISVKTDGVYLQDLHAQRLIFCEGYRAINNPWFDWLPFKPAKGEILTVKIERDGIDEIINAGKWLLPIGNKLYRFGSTYEWQSLNEQTTDNAQQELLQALTELMGQNNPVKLVRHEAGVRPCTKDTMPFIGLHPQHPRLGMFNGFGSKGSLMIPYYADQFSKRLQGNQVEIAEADIRRYWHHEH
jgi:glycine/D-amino acid oxidase-like deaminating enzyme